ncbi:hypothetical protein [Absidia glauca]|uniref:GST N-terminal domain-containing protein n=1 Tax=Absidia glauca TaxID=4829 RepID=A0A163IYL0_ABSGL|nr:hypothetical protein [Absidia glauca]
MSHIKLYDIRFGNEFVPRSPNVFKIHIALNFKGIPYETEQLDFLEIQSLLPSVTKTGVRPTVPVIVDKKHQNHAVQDSWDIAKYLDSAYPDTPPLIQTDNEGLQFFFYNYCHGHILIPAFRLCVMNIYHLCPTQSVKHFFRANREARFNMTLEEFAGEESTHIAELKSALGLIHTTLTSYRYISGDEVGFADVTLAAIFAMVAAVRNDLLEPALLDAFPDDILRNWWNRMEPYTKYTPLQYASYQWNDAKNVEFFCMNHRLWAFQNDRCFASLYMSYTVLDANFEGELSISVLRNRATSYKNLPLKTDEFRKIHKHFKRLLDCGVQNPYCNRIEGPPTPPALESLHDWIHVVIGNSKSITPFPLTAPSAPSQSPPTISCIPALYYQKTPGSHSSLHYEVPRLDCRLDSGLCGTCQVMGGILNADGGVTKKYACQKKWTFGPRNGSSTNLFMSIGLCVGSDRLDSP